MTSTMSTDLNTNLEEVTRRWPDAPAAIVHEMAVALTEQAQMMASAPPVPMCPSWCTDGLDSHLEYDCLLDEQGHIMGYSRTHSDDAGDRVSIVQTENIIQSAVTLSPVTMVFYGDSLGENMNIPAAQAIIAEIQAGIDKLESILQS